MSSFEWVSMIAMAEFAALVTIVLAILLTRGWRGRRRDFSAADHLVSRVRHSRDQRRDELQIVLREKHGLEGEALAEQIQLLLTAERRFYDQFISTYLTRDTEAVSRMDDQLQDVLEPYTRLQAEQPDAYDRAEAASAPIGPGMDPKRVEELADEIRLYRHTLNRVFTEYTAMFGAQLDAGQELTAREVLKRLESGRFAGEEEGAQADDEAPTDNGAERTPDATQPTTVESGVDLPPEGEGSANH